jgi:hypothetical protein
MTKEEALKQARRMGKQGLTEAFHQHSTANDWAKPVDRYSIKHPVVAAAMIFYAIGFLVGYGVGKI